MANNIGSQSSYLGEEPKPVAFFSNYNHKKDPLRQLMPKSSKKTSKGKAGT